MAGLIGATIRHHWAAAERFDTFYTERGREKWLQVCPSAEGESECVIFTLQSPEQAERLASSILESIAVWRQERT